jgi:hypothetical protein
MHLYVLLNRPSSVCCSPGPCRLSALCLIFYHPIQTKTGHFRRRLVGNTPQNLFLKFPPFCVRTSLTTSRTNLAPYIRGSLDTREAPTASATTLHAQHEGVMGGTTLTMTRRMGVGLERAIISDVVCSGGWLFKSRGSFCRPLQGDLHR